MRKIECLKVCRGLVLAALGVVAVACTQTVGEDAKAESTATTTQAATKPEPSLFCADCFEETSGGGGGTPNGNGSNGFVGGVAGYASGTVAPVRLKASGDNTPCDPGVECVNVFGDPRPLDDSKIRVLIVGKEKGERVEADLPIGRGYPTRIDPPCKVSASGVATGICPNMEQLFKECKESIDDPKAWEEFCAAMGRFFGAQVKRSCREMALEKNISKYNWCKNLKGG